MQDETNSAAARANMVDRYLPPATSGLSAAPAAEQPRANAIDISQIRALLWRQRYIVLGSLVIALVAAFVVTLLTRPLYQASSTLQVQIELPALVEGEELLSPFISNTEVPRYLTTMGDVLKSRSMAARVVEMLELERDERLFASGEIPRDPETARQIATSVVQGGVEVLVPFNSRVLTLTVTASDPQLAADLANAYADAFAADDVTQGIEANAYAREYLESQIADVRQKLQDAELRSNAYARANRIVGAGTSASAADDAETGGEGGGTLLLSGMAQMNDALSEARADRIAAEQRWRTVSARSAQQLPEVQQNGTVQQLLARRNQAESELADLRERYRDDYPAVRELQAQVATLDGQISALGSEIKNSIRDQFETARRQEAALATELSRMSTMALDEQDRRIQYNLLTREADAYRLQLDTLQVRFNDISAASNLRSSSVRKLDAAIRPVVPSSPNLLKNLIVGLVLGLGLALVLAVLREVLDDKVRSQEDVERKLRVRTLGQTPFTAGDLTADLAEPFSAISEAYSTLRAALDFSLNMRTQFVLQFTSSQPFEGKSSTALAMAEKYAGLGRKVLLIDLDLRRPSLGKTLLPSAAPNGVMEVLLGRLPLGQAVVSTGKYDLLAVAKVPDEPAEVLSSGLVGELVEQARRSYDIVLIDCPPVMGIADAPLVSRFVDGVVFIVEANRSSSRQAAAAIRRLKEVNANIIGVVLTKYRAATAGDSYGGSYHYYTYNSKSS